MHLLLQMNWCQKEKHHHHRGPGSKGAKTNVTHRAPHKGHCSSGLCGAVKYGQRLRFTAVPASNKGNPSILILNCIAKLLINQDSIKQIHGAKRIPRESLWEQGELHQTMNPLYCVLKAWLPSIKAVARMLQICWLVSLQKGHKCLQKKGTAQMPTGRDKHVLHHACAHRETMLS